MVRVEWVVLEECGSIREDYQREFLGPGPFRSMVVFTSRGRPGLVMCMMNENGTTARFLIHTKIFLEGEGRGRDNKKQKQRDTGPGEPRRFCEGRAFLGNGKNHER